jgi:hypothetical protein
VKILSTLKIFKVNMSFKQVSTARLNKVVIAVNIPRINKGIL